MTFFTSDTHFSHKNIIKYCNRPFASIEEMDVKMMTNWNNVVKPDDLVYHLGDVTFGNPENLTLNGSKILIIGSHDDPKKLRPFFTEMSPMMEIKIEGVYITLCHYAMRVWPRSHYQTWHLYGHSHGSLPSIGKSHDVGVDNNNFTPVSFLQICEIMKNKPENVQNHERN